LLLGRPDKTIPDSTGELASASVRGYNSETVTHDHEMTRTLNTYFIGWVSVFVNGG